MAANPALSSSQTTSQTHQDTEAKLKAQSTEINRLKKALVSQTRAFRDLFQIEKDSKSGLETQVARLTAELKIRDQKLEKAKSESKMSQRVEELKRELINIKKTLKYERERKDELRTENYKLKMEVEKMKAQKEEKTLEKKCKRNSDQMLVKRVDYKFEPVPEHHELPKPESEELHLAELEELLLSMYR